MSRLPPSSVARSLSQPRHGYFRSPESDPFHASTRSPEQGGISPLLEEPTYRPQSQYPRLSGLATPSQRGYASEDSQRTPVTNPYPDHRNVVEPFEGIPRTESPEADVSLLSSRHDNLSAPKQVFLSRGSSADSPRAPVPSTLAPSASPLHPNPARFIHPESSDDDYTSSNAGSTFSKPRKLSSSSGVSLPHSPMSPPFVRSHPRSSSVSSDMSIAGNLPRPSFNFSRPLSRSSTNLSAHSPIIPHELVSSPSIQGLQRENRPDPITVPDPEMSRRMDEEAPPSSYIYTKYTLPRGRMVSRDSMIFSGLQTPHFEWKEPLFESPPSLRPQEGRTPSPSSRSQQIPPLPSKLSPPKSAHTSPSSRLWKPNPGVGTSAPLRKSLEIRRTDRSSLDFPVQLPRSQSDHLDDSKSTSADSASTIRPVGGRVPTSSMNTSAEEHVNKGIECHENGALQESTYHLRIAAKQNHSTGMLLYALACRHGWGMRPNQREGVQWLRKAVDSAGLDVDGDDESRLSPKEVAERKTRRAQFALGIYELGVSHLNGWGTEQDKALALRCFEIAAKWGDTDALAEAGYCYAEGIGCKKDLHKAAKYYRMAEAKGMNIVGNSWYVRLVCGFGSHFICCMGLSSVLSLLAFVSPHHCMLTTLTPQDLQGKIYEQ